ncbi:protein LAZY 1-like [Andrographis paniculata]|uniref:protein LAZY 1-like n=1 Tax=Andrographis paniculata TaxID=175694 RepID=UPI0021E8A814|nr:protein LAZY 1-like [Andrographis paniculata]
MKLLGWMHRKFRQNNGETAKDISMGYTGHSSMDDLQYYPKGPYSGGGGGNKPFGKSQRDHHYLRNSFTSLDSARVEEEDLEEDPSPELNELFHGFLAIGTLGTDPISTTEPATPTFSISVDHIAEKETEVTENELKLINDELEKVLGTESRDSCNLSSGRNSQVSAGRISHCSAITLAGKTIESAETYGNIGTITCPLQNYLFGSAIGLPETDLNSAPAKKDQRTSLGELFQKARQTEDSSVTKSEKRIDKETDRSAVHLVKKMLKKKIAHASGKNSAVDSTKLHKILQIFNRKVHPENSATPPQKGRNEIKDRTNSGGPRPSAEDIIIYPHDHDHLHDRGWGCREVEGDHHVHVSQLTKSTNDATGNELWVKSDANYLVLEL